MRLPFPPSFGRNISKEVGNQRFHVLELVRHFFVPVMPMVTLPAFVVVAHDQRAVNITAMETILETMGPFVASIWQLPYGHFDHSAIGISRFAPINQFRRSHGGVLYHRPFVRQVKNKDKLRLWGSG